MFGQTADEDPQFRRLVVAGNYNFQIVGDDSDVLIDSLFAKFPKTKRKGYIWKFKNVEIPGIDEALTFQVHQGLYGEERDTTKCSNGHYFTTFTNEKYKQQRLANQTPYEQGAITIYLKRGRQYGVDTCEEADLVKAFLLSLYEGA